MDSYGAQVSRILHISDSWNSLRGIVIKPTVNRKKISKSSQVKAHRKFLRERNQKSKAIKLCCERYITRVD